MAAIAAKKERKMFQKEVTTKDGTVKMVVASSQEELDEAVKVISQDEAPVAPDIDDPKDANKVVSPENTHAQGVEEISEHKDVDTTVTQGEAPSEPAPEDVPAESVPKVDEPVAPQVEAVPTEAPVAPESTPSPTPAPVSPEAPAPEATPVPITPVPATLAPETQVPTPTEVPKV